MKAHPAAACFPLMDETDLAELADDIRANGLRLALVTHGDLLLDGRNRLRACELAGVEPRFEEYVGDAPVAYVISLNLRHRHLSIDQKSMVGARLKPHLRKESLERQLATLRQGNKAPLPVPANLPEREGDWRDHAATAVGVSPRTIQHAANVLEFGDADVVAAVERGELAVSAAAELATLPKEHQREVMERVTKPDKFPKSPMTPREKKHIRGGQVRAYVRQVEKAKVAERLNAEPPPMPTGPFRVIVADPPWAYEKRTGDATHRGDLPYPPMTTEQICELDVGKLAHPGGTILWLWTTNAFMRDAYRVLDAWGFTEKTILTWVKDRMGLGDWLRGQTEHCILAVRGKPTVTLSNQTTVLHGPMREHSRKPDEFYALVAALCPGSKVEMFCRTPRVGWARWGAETELFDAA